MALKAGRIEEEWTRWRDYNQEKDKRQNHGLKHLAQALPVDMGTLRPIDARQMADEPLVVSRAQWLKEREESPTHAEKRDLSGPSLPGRPPKGEPSVISQKRIKERAKKKKQQRKSKCLFFHMFHLWVRGVIIHLLRQR
jgi:hypothetical protein